MHVSITTGAYALEDAVLDLPVLHWVGPEVFPHPDAVMSIMPVAGEFVGLSGNYENRQRNEWKCNAGKYSEWGFHEK